MSVTLSHLQERTFMTGRLTVQEFWSRSQTGVAFLMIRHVLIMSVLPEADWRQSLQLGLFFHPFLSHEHSHFSHVEC